MDCSIEAQEDVHTEEIFNKWEGRMVDKIEGGGENRGGVKLERRGE